jgi:hypothetical protein
MEQDNSREAAGVTCLQCGGDIFERRVADEGGWVVDHWYECACGCACVDCRKPMTFVERDTMSGTEYRSYRCAACGRLGNVRVGTALWKALEKGPPPVRPPRPEGPTVGWLSYDDLDGVRVVRLTPGEWVIGRDADCDVVVRSFACSRRHAKLVSGKPVVEGPVASGDELRLGQMLFRFVEGVVHPVTGRTYG